jgi:cellulose biosynthesis protein BcsQ
MGRWGTNVPYDTFLSYSHRDRERADRIKHYLVEAGLTVWMDRDQIELGDRFRATISEGIQQSRTITSILTNNALESPEVFEEVSVGIKNKLRIIPVILNPHSFSQSKRWRSLLEEIDWGLLDRGALSRNLTDEVLADIAKAIRRPDNRRCPVICVYHFKGGVGKTTIAAHLAAELYHSSKPAVSVLMVDCDAQSNLSSIFLTRQWLSQASAQSYNFIGMLEPNRLLAESGHFPIYREVASGVVTNETLGKAQTTLHFNHDSNKKLSIIPNAIEATKYGTTTTSQRGGLIANFQNAIQKLSLEYDFIILDCNPSTTLLSELAIDAATDILIPLRPDKYSSDGLENIDDLLTNFFGIEFVHGEGRDKKQLWTLVNFAELSHINIPNEPRSLGRGAEAELLRDIFNPLKAGTRLGQFKASLLGTRIPESGYLRSKPVETVRLDPDNPPSRSLRAFFTHQRAKPVSDAFMALATEMRTKTRSLAKMVSV